MTEEIKSIPTLIFRDYEGYMEIKSILDKMIH